MIVLFYIVYQFVRTTDRESFVDVRIKEVSDISKISTPDGKNQLDSDYLMIYTKKPRYGQLHVFYTWKSHRTLNIKLTNYDVNY
mgnify:FL=1